MEIKNGEMQSHSKDPNVVNEEAYLESSLLHIVMKIRKEQWCLSKVNKLIKKALEKNIGKKEQKSIGSQEGLIPLLRRYKLSAIKKKWQFHSKVFETIEESSLRASLRR